MWKNRSFSIHQLEWTSHGTSLLGSVQSECCVRYVHIPIGVCCVRACVQDVRYSAIGTLSEFVGLETAGGCLGVMYSKGYHITLEKIRAKWCPPIGEERKGYSGADYN